MDVAAIIAIIGGILLLAGIFGGGIDIKGFKIPPISGRLRLISAITGIVLLLIAILLSQPNILVQTPLETTPTATQTNEAETAIDYPTKEFTATPNTSPTMTQIPTPTSWPLGTQTTTDSKPLCTITVSDFHETSRENARRLQFNITGQGGYCSWIIPLNRYNASTKKQIAFWVKGEKGGEQYEVGIKDKITPPGQEPKVSETASTSWTQVFIPLDDFKSQDLSSLENFSLNFKVGSGTIYVDQLIFIPQP
jgi:hypothetical protein